MSPLGFQGSGNVGRRSRHQQVRQCRAVQENFSGVPVDHSNMWLLTCEHVTSVSEELKFELY